MVFSIDIIQAHLNFLEILYQKISIQRVYPKFYIDSLKKLNYFKILTSLYNLKTNTNFFAEYFKKIWYFFPSFSNIQNWIFFWTFNSLDLLLKKNLQLYERNSQYILNISLKMLSTYEYVFNNSNTILSFYATTMTYLCIKKKTFCLNRFDRIQIYIFFKKLKNKKGSYQSFRGEESDSRLNYCILTMCSLYNILTFEISKNCEYHTRNIQMKDGSFSGNKSREGHGSFFYCCIACLIFFSQKNNFIIIPISFNYWLHQKEKFFDFSLQGRTSKLTDCCYYFWLGASFILCSIYLPEQLFNGLIFSKSRIISGYSDKIGRSLDCTILVMGYVGFQFLISKTIELIIYSIKKILYSTMLQKKNFQVN
nr:geranylgeranyl transferase [Cryptomonas curvata]